MTSCSGPPASRAHGCAYSGLLLGKLRHRVVSGQKDWKRTVRLQGRLLDRCRVPNRRSSQHCGGRRRSWGGRGDGGTDTEAERQPPAPTAPALGGAEVTARQLLTQPLRPAWELPGDLPPTVGVSLGAGLSHGCSLNTEDPGCGRGLLLGAGRAVITAGLSALVGGMVVACALCVVGRGVGGQEGGGV